MQPTRPPRIKLSVPVDIDVQQTCLGTFITHDLNPGGVGINTPDLDLQPGSQVTVHFRTAGAPLALAGHVRHLDKGIIGIAFDQNYRMISEILRQTRRRQIKAHLFPRQLSRSFNNICSTEGIPMTNPAPS